MALTRNSIWTKILGGFSVLIIILIGSAFFLTLQLNNHVDTITKNTQEIETSLESLKELRLLLTKSKMLVSAWVLIPNSHVDKDELNVLHERDYLLMKKRLEELSQNWKKENQRQLKVTFEDLERMLALQQEIMQSLATFEDYNDINGILWQGLIENDITQIYQITETKLIHLIEVKEEESRLIQEQVIDSSNNLRWFAILVSLGTVFFGLAFAYPMAKSIIKPIDLIREEINQLSKGVLPERQDKKFKDYEIQQMAKAVDVLAEGIKKSSLFAEKIGQGKYETDFEALSEDDVLGNSLLKMQKNLKIAGKENSERAWFNEGLSLLGDMLKKNSHELKLISDDVLRLLIKYLNANQGRLFIVAQKQGQSDYLDLLSTYAWGKKKYIEQEISFKDGITGQVWKEKNSIYLTNIPQDYVKITSGLGHTNPNSLLVVPMMLNDVVFGVLELASLRDFSPIQRAFVQKAGENIASTISIIQNNLQSQKFLTDLQYISKKSQVKEKRLKEKIAKLSEQQHEND
jgi:HAMP domain-containing protein